MLDPVLREEVTKLEDKVDLARVDVDKVTELALTYDVSSIPHVISFVDGMKKSQFVGSVSQDEVAKFLKKLL